MLNLSLLSCSPEPRQGSHYFWALPQDFYFICLISCEAIPQQEPPTAAISFISYG